MFLAEEDGDGPRILSAIMSRGPMVKIRRDVGCRSAALPTPGSIQGVHGPNNQMAEDRVVSALFA